jgi:hypothetical protein
MVEEKDEHDEKRANVDESDRTTTKSEYSRNSILLPARVFLMVTHCSQLDRSILMEICRGS